MKTRNGAPRSPWLLCVIAAALCLGCSEFDRVRARAYVGDADAPGLPGPPYEAGVDVAQDLDAARGWFEAAAEQGQAQSFARLGKLYALGAGVPRDLVKGHMYFELSFRHGEIRMGTYLLQLQMDLSVAEIAQSLALADAWEMEH